MLTRAPSLQGSKNWWFCVGGEMWFPHVGPTCYTRSLGSAAMPLPPCSPSRTSATPHSSPCLHRTIWSPGLPCTLSDAHRYTPAPASPIKPHATHALIWPQLLTLWWSKSFFTSHSCLWLEKKSQIDIKFIYQSYDFFLKKMSYQEKKCIQVMLLFYKRKKQKLSQHGIKKYCKKEAKIKPEWNWKKYSNKWFESRYCSAFVYVLVLLHYHTQITKKIKCC